jgi:penicillin-binding protein 1C
MRWPLALVAVAGITLWLAVVLVPFPEDALAPTTVESRRFHDRFGRRLREARNDADGRGAWRPLSELGPFVGPAFVAIEDHRFYDHGGIDPRGIARAVRDNLSAGRVVAGGSTISQQTAKLILPQGRTIIGKFREALWALRLERRLDKAAILEQYVNRAPFGHGTFGVEAAAQLYFGRPTRTLTLAQTALLAGIPRAPSQNNPFTDPDRARARQRQVLHRMREVGAITEESLAEALAEPVSFAAREHVFAAPHFTTWALATTAPGDVHTTLDLDLQHAAEEAIASTLPALKDKAVDHAAAVVLHNRTGDVLAWVGSPDFFATDDGQNDMVVGLRQPGSTLKPFVYGLGLEQGFTAATRLPDLPLFFPTGLGDYRPRNYDRQFHGWVRLRTALANSYNVPAVWMAHQIDPGILLARLRDVGFTSLTRHAAHYGLGLALGNGEVQLIELANAYRALANDGKWSEFRWDMSESPPPRSAPSCPPPSPTCSPTSSATRWHAPPPSAAMAPSICRSPPRPRRAPAPTSPTTGPWATPPRSPSRCGWATSTAAPWRGSRASPAPPACGTASCAPPRPASPPASLATPASPGAPSASTTSPSKRASAPTKSGS